MLSYITKRYASLLTKFDVQMLFSWLKDAYGSVAKAARVAGIQRKTVYDWDSLKEEVRLETKLKVLEQNIKLDQNRTLEFLIRKNDNNLKEVLQHYTRYIYENSMKAGSKEDLSKYIELFHNMQKNHRGAVFDNQPSEIEEMNKVLADRAKKFEIDLPKPSIHTIRPEILVDKIIVLLRVIETGKSKVEEIRKTLDLPSELVENICEVLNYLPPSEDVSREYEEVAKKITLNPKYDWVNINGNADYLKLGTTLAAIREEKKGVR